VADTTGTVQERYAYDAYGRPTDGSGNPGFLTPSWGSRATSAFAWIYLHQGGRYDTTSGLYNFRNRDYSPTLGRWMEQDPIGFSGGFANLYIYAGNNAPRYTDPSGLLEIPGYRYDPFGSGPNYAQLCKNWAASEEKADKSWLNSIPSCPCDVGVPPKRPQGKGYLWLDPEPADQKYHPGASSCMRSIPGSLYGPGQQCCYDRGGKLITHGAGAGTPDKTAPYGGWPNGNPLSILLHYFEDVVPFIWCSKADMLDVYLKYRPPDNSCECKKNP